MKTFNNFSEIFLCRQFVDGRKQFNTLAALVELNLGRSPFDGSLYIFINKKRDLLKILYFDVTGFAMWTKKLEKDRFRWMPNTKLEDLVSLSYQQIDLLLQGFDITKMKPHQPVKNSRVL